MRPAAAFAERLGLAVPDGRHIEQALIHSSWLHEHPDAAPGHNERLEFLGDAVVNLAISGPARLTSQSRVASQPMSR